MKYFLASVGANLVAMSCAITAGYLAFYGRAGWGWFLFGAMVCAGSVTFGKKD